MNAYYRQETTHGYPLDEVVSALQKCIRRGLTDDAVWWAIELNESGYGAYAWRRLMVIVSEDIGLADHHAPVLVNALYQMSVELYKNARGRVSGPEKEKVRWNEESLTQAVCQQLSIITRGQPRMELDKRIRRGLGVLKRKGFVEEYKAKNVRVRLVAN